MRVLLSTLHTLTLASIDETGLLQQRISLDEASKTISDLDVDCKHGLHKCDKKKITTQEPTTQEPTTQEPTKPAGSVGECQIWGDPQVITFDKLHSSKFYCKDSKRHNKVYKWDDRTIDSYKDGEYYLLKGPAIEIQGRFGAGGGTHRSMQREVALKVGNEVLQVKPNSIWFNGAFSNGGENFVKVEPTDATGGFSITKKHPTSSWISVTHASVHFTMWLQQVANGGSPAVQALLYKYQGQLTSASSVVGLCGNHDGDRQNDCTGMINDVNLVAEKDSIFMAKPFRFAGCANPQKHSLWGWRPMGWVSNADTCAVKCKGFKDYHPEFLIKKVNNGIQCDCANLEKLSKDPHTARHSMSIDQMNSLDQSISGRPACSESSCTAVKPILPDQTQAVCIFSETKKSVPKDCPDRARAHFEQKCKKHFGTDEDIAACVIDMCQADDPDAVEAQDVEFDKEAKERRTEEKRSWSSKKKGGHR